MGWMLGTRVRLWEGTAMSNDVSQWKPAQRPDGRVLEGNQGAVWPAPPSWGELLHANGA